MTDNRSTQDESLLSLCAVLRWFDRELLLALGGGDADTIAALLASDLVQPAAGRASAYRLRNEIRAAALARLRDERPRDELELHSRAFTYFLRRMRQPVTDERAADEDRCFDHLHQLVLLLGEHMDWQTIATHITSAGVPAPRRPRNRRRLALYQGMVAIRTHAYDRGEALLCELLDQDDLEDELRAPIVLQLGHAQWFHTRYDRALALYQQAQAHAQAIGDRLFETQALLAQGMIYNELGSYEQAIELSEQSLRLARALGHRYREAHALYELGNNAMFLGRWQIAQDHFHDAIRLYEQRGVAGRLRMLYWVQGFLYALFGDEDESEAAYRRVLAISADGAGEPSIRLDTWLLLGLLYQAQGRWDEALAAYDQAIGLAQLLGNAHRLSLLDYRRGNVYERQGRPDAAMAAYRQAIDGIEALRGATEAEEIKIGLIGTTQQVYEAMVLLCLAQGRPAEAFEYVERARSRAFLDMLAGKHAHDHAETTSELYVTLAQPIAALAEIQSHLRDDRLLVEYYTIGVLPRGESLINKLPPAGARLRAHLALPPQTIIFAVTRDRLEVYRSALDPNTLRPLPGDSGPGRRLLRDRLLAHLFDQLIAPVEPLLHDRALLYLIPHGPLHSVPFMALRSSAGDHLLRREGPAIALAPSATILIRNCLGRPAGQGEGLCALGYNDEGDEALRYAEAEARHVARLAGGQAWTGREPKRPRLIAAGRRARWLHIAGHAIYDPYDPLGSALRIGQDDTLSARAIMETLEIGADLVTLSACTSGVTHVVPGDELLGLQRAFLYAGAPAVVCTLWEAADLVALLVMDHFYADLRRGRAPAEALRDAQVAVRAMTGRDLLATLARWRADDPALSADLGAPPDVPPEALDAQIYADPFYWAPFMLIGRPD